MPSDDDWIKRKMGPGIARFTRADTDSIRFLDGTPWIHIHYLTDDAAGEALGYATTELCCHECRHALHVLWTWPSEAEFFALGKEGLPELRRLRDDFQAEHTACGTDLSPRFAILCPPADRTKTVTVDLRKSKNEKQVRREAESRGAGSSNGGEDQT